jgi:bifunctional UDP-N-acetylglucosamine pyrophosphorylase/glucosamine-1-phosphate N-acetyltransferase
MVNGRHAEQEGDRTTSTTPTGKGLGIAVLAAGEGTRMRSALPKVLHPIAGKPLVEHVLALADAVGAAQSALVVAPDTVDQLRARLGDRYHYVVQAQRLGTGHALLQAQPALEGTVDRVLVLYGADPLMRPESVQTLLGALDAPGVVGAITTFRPANPTGYGRILRDDAGHAVEVVEERDATPAQRLIAEVNQGVVAYDAAWLWAHLQQLTPSPVKGEYYLTDLVALAVAQHGPGAIATVELADPNEALGVNDRVELAQAERIMRERIVIDLMRSGVTVTDPAHTYVDAGVQVGQDTVLLPGTMLRGTTTIGRNCTIGPNSVIENSTVADNCVITSSFLEEARVEEGCDIGPVSHLRPGAHVGPQVHLGNFAEVKGSRLHEGVKQGHFSYIGDATVGANVNIGAGTITANYGDKQNAPGTRKHRTTIGENTKIGSDTMLVAPVNVGANVVTGAGSVVTKDVPDGTTVVGVPARPLAQPITAQHTDERSPSL